MNTKVFIKEGFARLSASISPHIAVLMMVLVVPLLLLSSCRTSQKITKEEMVIATGSQKTASAMAHSSVSSLDSLFRMMSFEIDSIVLEFVPVGAPTLYAPTYFDYADYNSMGNDSLLEGKSNGLLYSDMAATSLTPCSDYIQSGGRPLPRDGLQGSPSLLHQANTSSLAKVKISGVRFNSEETITKNTDTSVQKFFTKTANDSTQSYSKEESSVTRESFSFVKAIGWLTIAFIVMIALVFIYRRRRWVIGVFTKVISIFR